MSSEIIFYNENERFMFSPARETTADTHLVYAPVGFTDRFRKAYTEWVECQKIINRLLTGQDLDNTVDC